MDRDGHYIHRPQNGMPGTRVLLIEGDGIHSQREWVHGEDFMVVQAERDELRRTLALINALPLATEDDDLRKLLDNAGLSTADGSAMRSLILWARTPSEAQG